MIADRAPLLALPPAALLALGACSLLGAPRAPGVSGEPPPPPPPPPPPLSACDASLADDLELRPQPDEHRPGAYFVSARLASIEELPVSTYARVRLCVVEGDRIGVEEIEWIVDREVLAMGRAMEAQRPLLAHVAPGGAASCGIDPRSSLFLLECTDQRSLQLETSTWTTALPGKP
jgi:hypothetical protein